MPSQQRQATGEQLRRLAEAVAARRKDLDRSQADVEDHGGPSNTTQTRIEAGLAPAPTPATLRKLDAGLDWTPGSARGVLWDGNQPVAKDPNGSHRTLRSVELGGGPLRRLLVIREQIDLVIEEMRGE